MTIYNRFSNKTYYDSLFSKTIDYCTNLLPNTITSKISFFKENSTGISTNLIEKKPKVIIIGSGPAGYTAAIYAARANLYPLVYEGSFSKDFVPGGQLMNTTKVENYPGFIDGIEGPDLMANLRKQALKAGATILEENALEVNCKVYPFVVKGQKTTHEAPAVIIATGAKANRPDIPGTRDGELWQRGVSACAVCDGSLPAFRNRPVFVIGGGDSCMEEALYLCKFASKVFIVHRRDQLRASKAMQKNALNNPKISLILNSSITQVLGEKSVKSVVIKNLKTGQATKHDAAGVFFAIGHTPNTEFLKGQLKTDAQGYIKVKPGTSQTSVPYIYAAGDVGDPTYRQAITAAGSGCMAALDAERALSHITK